MRDVLSPSHEELEERVRELTVELVDNHEFIWKLRENPIYLEVDGWKRLEEVTNKIYKNYTQRLKDEFPLLTELDIQFCIMLKLQFSISQICFYNSCIFFFCFRSEEPVEKAFITDRSSFV